MSSTTVILEHSFLSCNPFFSGINFSIEEFELVENDILLSIALVALVEIPAYIGIITQILLSLISSLFSVNAFLMDIIGRKPIILLSMLVAAIACIVQLGLQENDLVFTSILLVMKATVAGVFTLIR